MPDIGRFFNVDPLTKEYHWWSSYAFSGNMVTAHRELEGLEPVASSSYSSIASGQELSLLYLQMRAAQKNFASHLVGIFNSTYDSPIMVVPKTYNVEVDGNGVPFINELGSRLTNKLSGSLIMALEGFGGFGGLLSPSNVTGPLLANGVGRGELASAGRQLLGGADLFKRTDDFANAIVDINKQFSDGSELTSGALSSAINSASYYDDIADQGSAIFNSIVGHTFNNGNKRTASEFITQFAETNNSTLKLDSQGLQNLTSEIANGGDYSISQLRNKLFEN